MDYNKNNTHNKDEKKPVTKDTVVKKTNGHSPKPVEKTKVSHSK